MEHSAWNIEGAYTPGGPAEMSEANRLCSFWRPEAAMKDIVGRPNFFVPLLLVCFAGVGYMLVVMPATVRSSTALPMMLLGTATVTLIRLLIVAGLLAGIVAVFARSAVDFHRLLAVICYSRIPGVLFAALAIALILLRRASGLEDGHPVNPMMTNIAYFLDPAAHSRFLYAVAGSVDCVIFWELSLVAVGLRATSRVSSTEANASVVALWVCQTLVQAAWMQWLVR